MPPCLPVFPDLGEYFSISSVCPFPFTIPFCHIILDGIDFSHLGGRISICLSLSPNTVILYIVGFCFMNKWMIPCQFLCQRSLEALSCGPSQLASASSSSVANVIFPYLMGPELLERCKQAISGIRSHFTWHRRMRTSHLGIVTVYLVTFVPLFLTSYPTTHLRRLVNVVLFHLSLTSGIYGPGLCFRIKCAQRTQHPGFCLPTLLPKT